jgi:hypothetical protein
MVIEYQGIAAERGDDAPTNLQDHLGLTQPADELPASQIAPAQRAGKVERSASAIGFCGSGHACDAPCLKNAYVTLTEIETARRGLDLAQPNPFRLRCGAVDASDVLITSDDARAGHQASGLLQSGGVSAASAGLPAACARCARWRHITVQNRVYRATP